jgi:trehalose 6-phosphate synthase
MIRIGIRLILSLVVIIGVVAAAFSYWHVYHEENRLKTDLDRRAAILSESLKENIELVSSNRFEASILSRIVDKFSNRERLLGIAVFDPEGEPIAVSTALDKKWDLASGRVADFSVEAASKALVEGEFLRVNGELIHIYASPVNFKEDPSYTLALFHQASFIDERTRKIWTSTFLRVLVQALLISLVILFVVYLNVMSPLRKMTQWIKNVRLGRQPARLDAKEEKLLGPLAKEVSKMAASLETARLSAEEEARLRYSQEAIWTPERLKEFVKIKLKDKLLFVVSNREPYMHVKKGNQVECMVPASGMVTAIEPILKACGGTWIAHGSGEADRQAVDNRDHLGVPPEEPQYTLRRVWLSKEEEEGYYYGFSNEGLWPLCHIAHTRPIFREEDWNFYRLVNEKFAQVVLGEIEGTSEPFILIQDYHFALLPQILKSQRPDARIAIFWHIPWPNPESFGICPWQKELLSGMLGADIVGFHTQFHCNNFIETVDRTLESRINYEHFTVNREGHTTWTKPFPISIAFSNGTDFFAQSSKVCPDKQALLKAYGLESEWMGVGVDRLDYTKGILERLRSVERFLELNPAYLGKFTFVELGAPSRTLIPRYQELVLEIQKESERINERFKAKNWRPILLLEKHHSHQDILPFYKAADLCLVTSLHDGMNLVAKEFVQAREDEKGVLILSQFTGAARELQDALIINPYDIGQTAQAVKEALKMTQEEQAQRMKRMRGVLKERNIYKWGADLVGELSQIRLESPR